MTWDDGGGTGFGFAEGGVLQVQSQVCFTFVSIRTMTGEAMIGKNGPDLAGKINVRGRGGSR